MKRADDLSCGSLLSSVAADGRKAGRPLSEGISPVQGMDRKGPTAVLKSAGKMDHARTGGTLLNQKLAPGLLDTEEEDFGLDCSLTDPLNPDTDGDGNSDLLDNAFTGGQTEPQFDVLRGAEGVGIVREIAV